MDEFKPITTQQEFDAALGERLRRERETAAKRYEGWSSPEDVGKLKSGYDSQIAALTGELTALKTEKEQHAKELADRDEKIRAHESRAVKTRIAHELELPWELAERLQGEDEAAIRKDAEALKAALGSSRKAQPLATQEVKGGDERAALRALAENLK